MVQRGIDAQALAAPARVVRPGVLQRIDLSLVQKSAALGRFPLVRRLVLIVNHLGNGWIYPLLGILLWWFVPGDFVAIALAAGGSAAIAHAIYPLLKRKVARPRPFDVDPSLRPLSPVLDRFAFPSGHCMTVTAVLTPITVLHMELLPWTVATCLLVAVSRVLAAHHYPTDLVAGIALGALASLPVVAVI